MNRLEKAIKQLEKQGVKEIYINSINCTVEEISCLKRMIANGKLTPIIEELKAMIKEEYISDFLQGKRVCPQMTYKVKR